MKPIPAPQTFSNTSPPWNLTFLDNDIASVANAINDVNTYSNCFPDTSATANQITVNLPAGLTFELQFGVSIQVLIANTNTSATVNLSVGSSVAPVVGVGGNPVAIGLLAAGGLYNFQYDGTHWQVWQVVLTTQQIGALVYPVTAAETAAGVTPSNFQYPPGNVLRYGADPTGTNDSAPAIQTAINILNNWTTYTSSIGNKTSPGPDFAQGGEVYIPGGVYLIGTTILLAPGIKLRGAVAVRNDGTNYAVSGGQSFTVLKAKSTFPANQYLIDNGIYRLKDENSGNPVTPARSVLATDIYFRANDTDNLYCNFMQNMTVSDMQLDCAGFAAGGLRCQGAAFFYIDGVSIINSKFVGFYFAACFEFGIGKVSAICPAPLVIVACESAMQDGAECELYAVSNSSWISANQSLINSIIYPFNDPIGNWYNLTLKSINIQWSINVTLSYLSANSGNVGIELYHSNCNILHWENEFSSGGALFLLRVAKCRCDGLTTKSVMPLATGDGTSRLVIREPGFIQSTTSFTPLNAEASSTFEIQIHNYNYYAADTILGVSTQLSTVNVSRLFPYAFRVTLYVDSSGNSAVAGLLQSTPTTIDGAFNFINNNPHIKEWNILVNGGETHTISVPHTLENVDISVIKASGANPTIAINSTMTLIACRLQFAFVGLTSNQTQYFFAQGVVNIEITSSSFVLAASSVMFAAATNCTAKIIGTGFGVSANFGSSSGMCSGGSNGYIVYEDSMVLSGITGTFSVEGITSGKVFNLHSNL